MLFGNLEDGINRIIYFLPKKKTSAGTSVMKMAHGSLPQQLSVQNNGHKTLQFIVKYFDMHHKYVTSAQACSIDDHIFAFH